MPTATCGSHAPLLWAALWWQVFVYVVLRANPPRIASTLAYVQRFRSPMALKSEAGCYFTHLQAAVCFLESLAIENEEKLAAAEGGSGGDGAHAPSGAPRGSPSGSPLNFDPLGVGAPSAVTTINLSADANGAMGDAATPPLRASGTALGISAAPTSTPSPAATSPSAAADPAHASIGESLASAALSTPTDAPSAAGDEGDVQSTSGSLPLLSRKSSDPPTFSRAALAARRAQQVESAASTWERQIEGLIGSNYSLADGSPLSRQVSEYASELGGGGEVGTHSGSIDLEHEDVERCSADEPEAELTCT